MILSSELASNDCRLYPDKLRELRRKRFRYREFMRFHITYGFSVAFASRAVVPWLLSLAHTAPFGRSVVNN